jgi:hypothetical protein
MLVNEIEAEQLDKFKKVTERLYELMRKKRYVDFVITIHNGEIRLWVETVKYKP